MGEKLESQPYPLVLFCGLLISVINSFFKLFSTNWEEKKKNLELEWWNHEYFTENNTEKNEIFNFMSYYQVYSSASPRDCLLQQDHAFSLFFFF